MVEDLSLHARRKVATPLGLIVAWTCGIEVNPATTKEKHVMLQE